MKDHLAVSPQKEFAITLVIGLLGLVISLVVPLAAARYQVAITPPSQPGVTINSNTDVTINNYSGVCAVPGQVVEDGATLDDP